MTTLSQYNNDGYLFPLTAFREDGAAALRDELEAAERIAE